MKKISALALFATLPFASIALSSDIGHLAWNRSNVETLRSFDKAAVVEFLDELRRDAGSPLPVVAGEIGQFEWVDVAGNGKYRLVLTGSGPCVHYVMILTKNAAGRVRSQNIDGWADLSAAVRDLNGDGKDELIVQKLLIQYDCASTVVWPAVYRLENGKYVEVSRDFPEYYDNEVLPVLERRIGKYRAEGETGQLAAEAEMMRDKILRVLGRDPAAGLRQAREWMSSDDPDLLRDAGITFQQIGGHQKELLDVERALSAAKKRGMEPYDPRLREGESRSGEPIPKSAQSSGGEAAPGSVPNSGAPPPGGTAVHGGGFIP